MSNATTADPPEEPLDWLPPLILMSEYEHSFNPYIEAVYAIFRKAFVTSQPQFQGRCVQCRRDPIYDGKEDGFWHCTSEGKIEEERTPDMRRCERIRWPRAIIEHSPEVRIDYWETGRRGDPRAYLWFNEEYLVVLADRRHSWLLITAFCTPYDHNKRKLRRERDECQQGSRE